MKVKCLALHYQYMFNFQQDYQIRIALVALGWCDPIANPPPDESGVINMFVVINVIVIIIIILLGAARSGRRTRRHGLQRS